MSPILCFFYIQNRRKAQLYGTDGGEGDVGDEGKKRYENISTSKLQIFDTPASKYDEYQYNFHGYFLLL